MHFRTSDPVNLHLVTLCVTLVCSTRSFDVRKKMPMTFLASRLHASNGLYFVLSCVLFAFVGHVDYAGLNCLTVWVAEFQATDVNLLNVMPTDVKNLVTSWNYGGQVFRATSAASDAVMYIGMGYSFYLMSSTLYTLCTLCFSGNWYMSRCARYQVQINAVGLAWSIILLAATAVYCHFLRQAMQVLEPFRFMNHSLEVCLEFIHDVGSLWCPIVILICMVLAAVHFYVVKITREFAAQVISPSRSDKDVPDVKISSEENKFSFLSVKNLVASSEDQRPRLPSTRMYPSSPIVPSLSGNHDRV